MRIQTPSRFDEPSAWLTRGPRSEINAALRALIGQRSGQSAHGSRTVSERRSAQAGREATGAERSHWGVGREGEPPVASDTEKP